MSDLGFQKALDRTNTVLDVVETPECSGIELVDEQVVNGPVLVEVT